MRYAGRHRRPSTRPPAAAVLCATTAAGALVLPAFPASAHTVLARPASSASQLRLGYRAAGQLSIRQAVSAVLSYIRVRPGDTLSGITQRVFGSAALWPRFYAANRAVVGPDPNRIFAGEVLRKALAPARGFGGAAVVVASQTSDSNDPAPSVTVTGTLSCSGLEKLWEEAGGAHDEAFLAAEIAMAESGGRQYATGLAGERGYWQINPDHGALSTYDPLGNAKAAVIISADGTNWTPWTTYTSGAYAGRC